MVIATPVTVVSAITSAARHGVLIKGGEYLEALGRTCAMAFDKTGSLTEGRLEVSAVEGLNGTAPDDVVRLAVAVEQRSEHPIAKAIVSHAQRESVTLVECAVTEFEARTGRGAVARVDGRELRVGTPDLFPDESLPERFRELEEQGNTVVLVGDSERLLGLIALADRPRAPAARVLRQLERLGVHERVMLTGDHELVAGSIARELGIADVRARLQPADKVKAVENLRRSHDTVAMLGDGVNDAPALAAASVGIAMGAAGSPATIETADVALMADDLAMLPYAVQLAKRARRVIMFSIGIALGLKVLLAAGAVGGVVSLLVAVLVGDMGASLVVTLNAMRLAKLSPERV
jgi:Cd2+/Zn2+-exporting ATPase